MRDQRRQPEDHTGGNATAATGQGQPQVDAAVSGERTRLYLLLRIGFESMLLFGLIALLAYALRGSVDLNGLNPHPFWIPVILISAHYGTYAGLFVALQAILFNFALDWPVQAGGEDYFAFLQRIWTEPVMWIAIALLLGELRIRNMADFAALEARADEAASQRRHIAAYCNTLQEENRRLEHLLAIDAAQATRRHLHELASFGAETEEELEDACRLMLQQLFPKASLRLVPARDGRLLSGNGCTMMTDAATDAFTADRRCLTILDQDDVRLLRGCGQIAAPMLSASGELVGALVAGNFEAADLATSAPLFMRLLAGEAARSYAEACEGFRNKPLDDATASGQKLETSAA